LSKIINYHKWEALINFLREKERKNTSEGKKEKKKTIMRLPACVLGCYQMLPTKEKGAVLCDITKMAAEES